MAIFGLNIGKSKKTSRARGFEADSMQPAMGTHGAPYADGHDMNPQIGDLTFSEYAQGVPNIRLSEMFKSFGRQLKWLIPLFLIGTAAAWYLTKDFKRTYTGNGRVMVQLGEEYVYNPVAGNATSSGLMLTPDSISINEVGIIKNDEVMDQVIGEMTPDDASKRRFNKSAFNKLRNASNERERQDAFMELRKFVDRNFVVMPQPKSSVIDLVFKHEDPDVAVETLNAFIDAYLSYRRTIFVEGSGDIISERRKATEEQLTENEKAIARFLRNNRISDFGSEQTGLRKRTEDLKTELNKLRAQISETESSLAVVEDQLRQTNPTIDLYVDDRASQRVAQAELELKQLLAKYLPSSDPVRQKQTEITELKSLQNSYNGKATGGRRVGPNPVHQALVTRANTLKATANSYREKEFTLQNQLNSADGKIKRLTSLSPQYQNLLRERDTLSQRLKTYNAKEQEALINQSQAEANSENVRVISYAKYPSKGRNMRLLMFALATVGWGFTLFMLALLRVFLDPKLYVQPGPSVQAIYSPRGRRQMDRESAIPEPVAPYMPSTPAPQYEPAAAGPTEWVPDAAPAAVYQAQPAPTYADGSTAIDSYANPYGVPQEVSDPYQTDAMPVFGLPPK